MTSTTPRSYVPFVWQISNYVVDPLHREFSFNSSDTRRTNAQKHSRNRSQVIRDFITPLSIANTTVAVQEKYYSSINRLINRLKSLDLIYEEVLHEEEWWPSPENLPHPKVLYNKFYQELVSVSINLVCGSCRYIFHNSFEISLVPMSSSFLDHLHIPRNKIEFFYSSSNPSLDSRELMIDPLSVNSDDLNLYICHSCLLSLQSGEQSGEQPVESLANYRWINSSQPHALQDLTWLEERLVARGYLSAMILRLEKRAMNHYGLKSHVIVLPQETTQLTNLLPRVPATLAVSIKVVWAGRGNIDRSELISQFTVNKHRVYNALIWLCGNHADYKNVQVNCRQFELWPPVLWWMNLSQMLESLWI